ncbi:MAG: hypothetical protein KAR47_21885 [Planctomycetes bacterium]|nr:hypothetical protein [Planctomycetota bacterium]
MKAFLWCAGTVFIIGLCTLFLADSAPTFEPIDYEALDREAGINIPEGFVLERPLDRESKLNKTVLAVAFPVTLISGSALAGALAWRLLWAIIRHWNSDKILLALKMLLMLAGIIYLLLLSWGRIA